MAVAVCRSCGRELTEQDLSGSTERGLCLDCSQEVAQKRPQEGPPGAEPRESTRHERRRKETAEGTQEATEIVYDPHRGAHNVADWLGGLGWFILIGGLVGSLIAGIAIGTSCETTVNDCSDQIVTAWIVGIAGAVQSIIVGVLFFAGRHVVLLLTEIAER